MCDASNAEQLTHRPGRTFSLPAENGVHTGKPKAMGKKQLQRQAKSSLQISPAVLSAHSVCRRGNAADGVSADIVRRSRAVLAGTLIFAQMIGCATNETVSTQPGETLKGDVDARDPAATGEVERLSANAAEAIARKRITSDPRYGGKMFKTKVAAFDGGWNVYVVFQPAVPGGDLVVSVRHDGRTGIVPMW